MKPRKPAPAADSAELVILCVGRTDRREFREALPSLAFFGKVIAATHIDSALDRLAEEELTPDAMVIVQSYPGEFSDAQIDRLHRIAPLARLIALLGTWCEGEMRSGTPWPGAVRVYWHQWLPHCHRELGRLLGGRESIWSLPPTTGEEERCLAIAARKEPQGAGVVEIISQRFDVYQWLAAACRDRGYRPHWRRSPKEPSTETPVAILLDAAGPPRDELARMRLLRADLDLPLIVLADFPRICDCQRFVQAGARAVLSCPFFWADLFWYFGPPRLPVEPAASEDEDRSCSVQPGFAQGG